MHGHMNVKFGSKQIQQNNNNNNNNNNNTKSCNVVTAPRNMSEEVYLLSDLPIATNTKIKTEDI
jgi:hypothetical protein